MHIENDGSELQCFERPEDSLDQITRHGNGPPPLMLGRTDYQPSRELWGGSWFCARPAKSSVDLTASVIFHVHVWLHKVRRRIVPGSVVAGIVPPLP